MKRLTILFDADDTVEDLLSPWLEVLNSTYGTAVMPQDVTNWNVASFFPSLTKEQVFAPLYDGGFWSLINPIENSVPVFKRLIEDGHDLYVVTASNYQTCAAKVEMLLEMFPLLDWNHIILTSNKQLIRGDILVDDGPHNLIGGEYTKFLFDRPHNRSFDEKTHGMRRVYTWNEIYNEIGKLAND